MAQAELMRAEALYDEARSVLAGGVAAGLRLHPFLGRPFYIARAEGSRVFDPEGNPYLDFNLSNGAILLGHRDPSVEAAVIQGLQSGNLIGETPEQVQLAVALSAAIPSAEDNRVRFANSGTEAVMVAIRLARGATGRAKILRFDGHNNGLADTVLFRRGSDGAALATSAGVPDGLARDVVVVPWNDSDAFEVAIARHGHELAAVICEPVFYNGGCILPEPGFLHLLRDRTHHRGIVLIFDEVLSGFRMCLGGAQEWSGVTPDLTTLAKSLANGLPLAALVGRRDLMDELVPTGRVMHSGTYTGHQLGVRAALATLEVLRQPHVYERVAHVARSFYPAVQDIFDRRALPIRIQGLGSRFGLFFGRSEPVRRLAEAAEFDQALFAAFTLGCLERGVYFHVYNRRGLPWHAGFSLAHSDQDLASALDVIDAVAERLAA